MNAASGYARFQLVQVGVEEWIATAQQVLLSQAPVALFQAQAPSAMGIQGDSLIGLLTETMFGDEFAAKVDPKIGEGTMYL
ncbi:hypothetical protein [Sulfidibacter corallicola]|uniref:Uncharacterized protein n=1 Tax=Sulfidibacter corallicola TaxID=2818388 RepID=A0A8A4THE0_SULCO|nr:hypothetical protein [Sulfidibacter corallicola]QTD48592.1 hypothetical protein J3U87_23680 [Sulfidibacter corallicola]